MKKLFWILYYLFHQVSTKSEIIKKECRINGWKYQEIRVQIHPSDVRGLDHRTETFVFME